MATEEYSAGYEAGYQDGQNAVQSHISYSAWAQHEYTRVLMEQVKDMSAKLAQLSVPPGWKPVPVEATAEMRRAGHSCTAIPSTVWCAMLNAAPQPPAQREWVELTDEEITLPEPALWGHGDRVYTLAEAMKAGLHMDAAGIFSSQQMIELARAIEAKLRERNGGWEMLKAEFEARQLVGRWLARNKLKQVSKMRHVHPRAYVVGYAAPRALIVARPWMDSEEHLQDFDLASPLDLIHTFDESLKAGDWCATAYVCMEGRSETVAVAWRKAA